MTWWTTWCSSTRRRGRKTRPRPGAASVSLREVGKIHRAGRRGAQKKCPRSSSAPLWVLCGEFRSPSLLHLEGVLPQVEPPAAPHQAETPAEQGRGVPTTLPRRLLIAGLAAYQDLKLDFFATRIDQPVFGDAGPVVALAQTPGVLADGALADNLQHPVRRAFQFLRHLGLTLHRYHPDTSRFQAFPGDEGSIGFGG